MKLYWVPGTWTGKLCISTRPRGGDWLADDLGSWCASGIRRVVSLLELAESRELDLLQEGALARLQGIDFLTFPIRDMNAPDETGRLHGLAEGVLDGLRSGLAIAVHCRQGIGRSGLVAVSVLMIDGLALDDAVRTVSVARGLPVPVSDVQKKALRDLGEHLRRRGPPN